MDSEKRPNVNTAADNWSSYLKNNVEALAKSGAASTAAAFNRAVSSFLAVENKTPKKKDGVLVETPIRDRRLIKLPDITIRPDSYSSLTSEEGEDFHETGFNEKEINNAMEDGTHETMNSLIHTAREAREYYKSNKSLPEDTTKLVQSLQALQNIVDNLSPEQATRILQTAWIKDETVGFHTKDVLSEMSARKKDLAFLREFCDLQIRNNKKKGVVEKFKLSHFESNAGFEKLLETLKKLSKDSDEYALDYIKKAAGSIIIQHTLTSDKKDVLSIDNEALSQMITMYTGDYKKIEGQFKWDSIRNTPSFNVVKNNESIFNFETDRANNIEIIARDFPNLLEKGQESLYLEKKNELNFQSRCQVLKNIAKYFFPDDKEKEAYLNGYLQQLVTQTSYSPHILLLNNIYYHHLGSEFCVTCSQDKSERLTELSINSDNTLTAKLNFGPVVINVADLNFDIIVSKYNNGEMSVNSNNYFASLAIIVDIEDPNNTKVTNVEVSILPPEEPKKHT